MASSDAQVRQGLQKAFQEQDRDRRGQIDPHEVEQTLRRYGDSPECRQKLDDGRIRQEAEANDNPFSRSSDVVLGKVFSLLSALKDLSLQQEEATASSCLKLATPVRSRSKRVNQADSQTAKNFVSRGRPVSQQEIVDYYAARLRE